jgi:hypothetical protein
MAAGHPVSFSPLCARAFPRGSVRAPGRSRTPQCASLWRPPRSVGRDLLNLGVLAMARGSSRLGGPSSKPLKTARVFRYAPLSHVEIQSFPRDFRGAWPQPILSPRKLLKTARVFRGAPLNFSACIRDFRGALYVTLGAPLYLSSVKDPLRTSVTPAILRKSGKHIQQLAYGQRYMGGANPSQSLPMPKRRCPSRGARGTRPSALANPLACAARELPPCPCYPRTSPVGQGCMCPCNPHPQKNTPKNLPMKAKPTLTPTASRWSATSDTVKAPLQTQADHKNIPFTVCFGHTGLKGRI